MWPYLAVILFFIFFVIFITNREPPMLTELKQRYREIMDMLRKSGDPMWSGVLRDSIITGMVGWSKEKGPIGSNVNKGYEIYICLDGDDVNSALYILIHELAHMSVKEYDHTANFWENFKKLKELCIQNGIYTSGGNRSYCGDIVRE